MLDSMTFDWNATFLDLLQRFRQAESIGTDDVIGAVRGLLEEVRDLHEAGRVADLDRVDLLALTSTGELTLGTVPVGDPASGAAVAALEAPPAEAVDITRRASVLDDGTGITTRDLAVATPGEQPSRPVFYPGYASWERAVGQHDALTDVFHLGLLIASLATRLDFRETADIATFARHRANVVRLNPRLHPVLARVIADMTELRRADRAADLSGLIDLIDDYRSLEVDDADIKAGDLAEVADPVLRRQRTQEYFRNRLFEVTRRNKLLYFADRHGVDLTRGSFPFMLSYQTLQARQLLTTSPDLLQRLTAINDRGEAKGELDLRRWLQCTDYPYLAPSLDKVRSAARKDSRELGFNQLRLVLAFLRWHDDDKAERINTPLVMLPVTLKRQPGTSDGFSLVLEAPVTEAEVNPVLRYVLADRFRIDLPETIDMTRLDALRELGERLEREVRRARPGVAIRIVDKPRVQLFQTTIKRQLEEHRRRQRRTGQQLKDWRGVGYSYASENYQPLGYELFDRFVRPKPAPGRELATGTPAVVSGLPDPGTVATSTAATYAYDTGEHADPLNWEIDLCAVTLANFNTRKMSLVRDYETLLDGYGGENANYRRLFEHGPRPQLRPIEKPSHAERNFVLPSDPSQDEAILRASTGESYVIQGPPGTGKSQTIANLLADLAARGKSVLFVCEKRVALDVVHSRLKDAGIGDLASLVHDAREDRLPFIADLKGLYEGWLASRTSRTIRDRRSALASEIDALIMRLRAFSAAMQRSVGSGDTTVRGLMGLAIAQSVARPRLSLREREATPAWGAYIAGEAALVELERTMRYVAHDRDQVLGLLSALRSDLADLPQPIAHLESVLPAARRAVEELEALVPAAIKPTPETEIGLGTLLAQAAIATRLRFLAEHGGLALLDRYTPEAIRLDKDLRTLDVLDAALAQAENANTAWRRKPPADETETLLALARRKEGRFWSFLSGDWRALRQRVAETFAGKPENHVAALEQLALEHAARAARDDHLRRVREISGLDDIAEIRATLEPLWQDEATLRPAERALVDAAIVDPEATGRGIVRLAAERRRVEAARQALETVLTGVDHATPAELGRRLETLDAVKEQAVELAERVRALELASPALAQSWRRLPLPLDTMRAAALHMELQRSLAQAPEVNRTTAADVQRIAEDLGAKLAELRQLNARRTLDERKSRFRAHSAARDDDYDVGRAFLEHQFSLQRPSAALRDFLAGAPGHVVRDLKPIWMMSPLSVADTLPLEEGLFDVVVFDEASQIPVEDAVPTLYRAPQAIVVGDEMQLPPPSYFGRKLDTDEEDLPDYIAFGMQAESLLDKAAVALPSVRLEWHYRSRHEGLIGFCNQAFYAGHLKTIPSRQILFPSRAIDTSEAVAMKEQAQRVLARPISFHRIADGSFVGQRNLKEAAYIADLVRALLSQDSKTIGIVAFSQPQQAAIEDAIERLAADNPTFRNRLDRAMGLDQEELFVKNLENVQGDERDIMIVSVAYGPGAQGRMIMNFGPINQDGGEKRLNVIFSRAKHHMVVVTSIEPAQITNEWNKGANALKRYLMYAAAASVGDTAAMRTALAGYPGADHVDRAAQLADPLADHIAATLQRQGREVARGLGQSTARCDVAIKDTGSANYATAILTDNDAHYQIADVVDRYVTYPGLLKASGWKVELALAKDWVARIVRPGGKASGAHPADAEEPTAETAAPATPAPLPEPAIPDDTPGTTAA